ncbi:MAG: 2-dehydro-3-deoxyglucarate aldolase [Candidatus Atribacteria bacterium]|nr:2-dehydro-3-deoxyglucarate aldolase [Candidatus Atribacteria bacterium]
MNGKLLKDKLEAKKPCVGSWVTFADPTITEVLCGAGYDFLVIDAEHAPLEMETVQLHLLATKGEETIPLVRVPWNDLVYLKRVLDIGAPGVVIPMVRNREEAERAISFCLYPPEGIRGFGPRRAAGYERQIPEYVRRANEEILIILQIEHFETVENLEEILQVQGLTAILIGPWDLSGSLGLLGETNHPRVREYIDIIIEKANVAHIPVGIAASSKAEEVIGWFKRGVQFVTAGTDYGLLSQASDSSIISIKKLL